MKPQSGFTLIELVIVIVILGILAATALPRFSDISTDARLAALNGLAGSIRSAAAIARATQLARGLTSGQAIALEGQAISMSAGYPTAANISMTLTDITNFTVALNGSVVDFKISNLDNCRVRYAEPTASPGRFTATIVSSGGADGTNC